VAKWEKWEKLENSVCVTKSAIANTLVLVDMHYHTSFTPTEAAHRWYMDNGWSVSSFCHAQAKKSYPGDPYTNSMNCDLSDNSLSVNGWQERFYD